MTDKSKFRAKVDFAGLSTVKTSDRVVVMPKAVPKTIKPKADAKPRPCYIFLGRLKDFPKILITQVRFEPFGSLEDCEQWCQDNCSEYEIRDNKSGQTLTKVGGVKK